MEGGAGGSGPAPAGWDSPVGPAGPRSRSGRAAPGPGAPAPRAAWPLVRPRGWGEGGASGDETRGRGWGESGEVFARVGPALAGYQVATRVPPTVTFWLTCKGPDFPKGLMYLPLRFDSSPGISGRASVRKGSLLVGQLKAGFSNV